MATVVSSMLCAASPYASATMARKTNASLCSHDGEIYLGNSKNLPLLRRSLVVPQDINDQQKPANLEFKIPPPPLLNLAKLPDSKRWHSLVASVEAQFQDKGTSVRQKLFKNFNSLQQGCFYFKKANKIITLSGVP